MSKKTLKHAFGYTLLVLIFLGLPLWGIYKADPIVRASSQALLGLYLIGGFFVLINWLLED